MESRKLPGGLHLNDFRNGLLGITGRTFNEMINLGYLSTHTFSIPDPLNSDKFIVFSYLPTQDTNFHSLSGGLSIVAKIFLSSFDMRPLESRVRNPNIFRANKESRILQLMEDFDRIQGEVSAIYQLQIELEDGERDEEVPISFLDISSSFCGLPYRRANEQLLPYPKTNLANNYQRRSIRMIESLLEDSLTEGITHIQGFKFFRKETPRKKDFEVFGKKVSQYHRKAFEN